MKRNNLNSIIDTILLVVLGIVLLVKPGETIEAIFRIIGTILLVMGVVKIIAFFVKKEKKDRSVFSLILGIVQVVLGLVLIAKPILIVSIWYVVAAVILGFGAIISLIRAIRQMKAKSPVAVVSLVLSIITLILAIVVFVNPTAFAAFQMKLIGISFVIEGAALLLVSFKIAE